MTAPRTSLRQARRHGGFTIVEVLATLTLAAIVLPPVVNGVLVCLATAGHARDQARAASLAQSKLAELVVTGELYDAEMAGDFGEDLPQYTWTAEVSNWQDSRLSQLDVSVIWARRGREYNVTLSTLVYAGSPSE
ncbi:MAG TPA: prepilin-type N-terminal cleavage/methylation domain-containing protein [Phycisphaerae bacterium]|nr:prepilin-type N-terminal cleavage/methylation domain-containing protein [Phycisphaerae bacterium]